MRENQKEGLELCLRAKMKKKKKITWTFLKHCDGGSVWNHRQNEFGRPIPCGRLILTVVQNRRKKEKKITHCDGGFWRTIVTIFLTIVRIKKKLS